MLSIQHKHLARTHSAFSGRTGSIKWDNVVDNKMDLAESGQQTPSVRAGSWGHALYEDDVLYLLMYDNIINHNITHQYTECNIRSPLGGGGGGDSSGGRLLYTPHQSLPSLTVQRGTPLPQYGLYSASLNIYYSSSPPLHTPPSPSPPPTQGPLSTLCDL